MTNERERALQPEDLTRLFVEFGNAGDAEGLAGLYEADAVVACEQVFARGFAFTQS